MQASAYLNDNSLCHGYILYNSKSNNYSLVPGNSQISNDVYSLFILHDKLKIVTWISTN